MLKGSNILAYLVNNDYFELLTYSDIIFSSNIYYPLLAQYVIEI